MYSQVLVFQRVCIFKAPNEPTHCEIPPIKYHIFASGALHLPDANEVKIGEARCT